MYTDTLTSFQSYNKRVAKAARDMELARKADDANAKVFEEMAAEAAQVIHDDSNVVYNTPRPSPKKRPAAAMRKESKPPSKGVKSKGLYLSLCHCNNLFSFFR